jgi:hypothetical protein
MIRIAEKPIPNLKQAMVEDWHLMRQTWALYRKVSPTPCTGNSGFGNKTALMYAGPANLSLAMPLQESISLPVLLLHISLQARINKPLVGSESNAEVCSQKMFHIRTI